MENDGVTPTLVIIDDHSKRISDLEAKITELIAVKTTPTSIRSEREKQRYYQKREEINAKRRAAYKAKRTATVAVGDS